MSFGFLFLLSSIKSCGVMFEYYILGVIEEEEIESSLLVIFRVLWVMFVFFFWGIVVFDIFIVLEG